MYQLKLLLIAFIALCSIFAATNGKIINCYVGTWANYRPGDGAFKPSHIDPNLCTHVGYSFFGIKDSGEFKVLDEWLDLDSGLGHISKTMALKRLNKKLKVMAVVGGWNEGSVKYSRMAADPQKRKTFIDSTLKFIKQHGFDGLDLDWEYPAQRGGAPSDRKNFVILLKELYEALHPLNLELSIAVGASSEKAPISYDIPKIAQYVDFINVMTYDFHTKDGHVAGANTALRGDGVRNVESSMKYWLQGAPANKLVMGLAFYGHTFKLANPKQFSLGSPSTDGGEAGPYTKQSGFLGYNEICLLKPQMSYYFDKERMVPVLHNSRELISYDDEESIGLKVDLGKSLNLAGFMIWSIETDDFHGRCGTKYPLLKTINNRLGNLQDMNTSGNELPIVPSLPEGTGVSVSPYPSAQEDKRDCSSGEGFFRKKSNCSSFYRCVEGKRYDYNCPDGLRFDVASNSCNWPNLVQC